MTGRDPAAARSAFWRSRTTIERSELAAGAASTSKLLAKRRQEAVQRLPGRDALPSLAEVRGLEPDALERALGSGPGAVAGLALPAWTHASDAPGAAPMPPVLARMFDHQRLGGLAFLAPLLSDAVSDVARAWGGRALDDAIRTLLERVGNLAAPTVAAEQRVEATGRLPERRPRRSLRTFVDESPMLVRRIDHAAGQWRSSLLELRARLREDRAELAKAYGAEGPITGLALDLGDRHRSGRGVAVVTFDGIRVVYKPRPCSLEVRLQQLMADVARKTDLPLHSRTILDRGAYGWDWWIDTGKPIDCDAVAAYFRRVGVLVGVLLPLRPRDLHCGNIAAHGAWPVLLDGETLLTPALRPGIRLDGRVDLDATVVATGAVPGTGTTPDVSALGVVPSRPIGERRSPDPHGASMPVFSEAGSLPLVAGHRVEARPWVAAVVDGFEEALTCVQANPGRWSRFVEQARLDEVRVVLRPTRFYAELQLAATEPAALADGLALDAVYDNLWLWPGATSQTGVLRSERTQLHDLDTPVFTAVAGGSALYGGDGTRLDRLVVRSGVASAAHDIEALRVSGRGAVVRQGQLLTAALTAGPAVPRHYAAFARQRGPLVHAVSIARTVADLAVPGITGLTWVRAEKHADETVTLPALGLDLYDGQPGVALFLGEVAHATRNNALRDVALAAAEEVVARLEAASLSAGLWAGASGVAWTLDRLDVLEPGAGLARARDHAFDLAVAALEPDATCLMSGAAGLALAAAAVLQSRPCPHAERAMRAARRVLVAGARRVGEGELSWANAGHEGSAVTGVAHGATGIGWGIIASAPSVGREPLDNELRLLATTSLRAEWSRFVSVWQAGQGAQSAEASPTWCHGPPGLALVWSRLLSARTVPLEAKAIADECLSRTVDAALADTDDVCHGSLGVAESLRVVAATRGREEVAVLARRHLDDAIDRARDVGWRLASTSDAAPVGLMTGLAGVGHVLLAFAVPSLPSVLTLRSS